MGEAIADKAELSLLDILLDRIKKLLLADLRCWASVRTTPQSCQSQPDSTDLKFGVGPTRDFHDHVEQSLLLTTQDVNTLPHSGDPRRRTWRRGGYRGRETLELRPFR